MKKRNWTLICLVTGVFCFGAFGIYNVLAKDNGTFELEDVAGDRSHLSDFPLEGYGGDSVNSFEFKIIDGEVDITYHSYDQNTMKNVRQGREIEQSEFMSYMKYAWNEEGSYNQTVAVPSDQAKREYKPEPSMDLFYEYANEYRFGETLKVDEVDLYSEVGAFHENKDLIARFPIGLKLKEPTIFTYGSTSESGSRTVAYMDTYKDARYDRDYIENYLKSFSTEVGDTVFAVTMPDERCEGTTYIYKVTLEEQVHRSGADQTLEERIMDRSEKGSAEPFLPVPDYKDKIIVGLEGIGEDYLAVFLVEENEFVAKIYDMDANLIGTARKELKDSMEDIPEGRELKRLLQANDIEVFYVEYEEGVSVSISVRDRVIMEEENAELYGSGDDIFESVTANMLLWVTDDAVRQYDCNERAEINAVRGNKILLIGQMVAPEKEEMLKVVKFWSSDTSRIRVLDAETLEVLYEGRIKNDFWQDDLKQLSKIDNAGGNAYVQPSQSTGRLRGQRAISELKPIGGRSGDLW